MESPIISSNKKGFQKKILFQRKIWNPQPPGMHMFRWFPAKKTDCLGDLPRSVNTKTLELLQPTKTAEIDQNTQKKNIYIYI